MLLLAYMEIKGNKGAMTPSGRKSKEEINQMSEEQRNLYFRSNVFPDGFSLQDVYLASGLIRKYPWGTSSRVYFEKPGQKGKMRPITIPPFMDKIVQKAIELVLHSIYEPLFETVNRSFGFRPNKGVHDAMIALTSNKTTGMRTAIEGDIQSAYDTVDKQILLEILRNRTRDCQFIKFIENRLNYDYVEKTTKERVKPELEIPQGGVDSPYLFNIYMHELDEYIRTDLKDYFNKLNRRTLGTVTRKVNNQYTNAKRHAERLKKKLTKIKEQIHSQQTEEDKLAKRVELYKQIRAARIARHTQLRITSSDRTRKKISIFYVRYADDWIILTNGTIQIGEIIRKKVSEFLEQK